MEKIDCKAMAQEILDSVKAIPNKKKLCILSVGHDPASESYMKGKLKDAEYCEVPAEVIWFDEKENPAETASDMIVKINELNHDNYVGGIIVQLPLPENMKDFEQDILNEIYPYKDVDGFSPLSPYKPCTPEGIMYIMGKEGFRPGDTVLLIGKGKLVGKPLINMLLDAGYTVTVAHSRTKHFKLLMCNPHSCKPTWDVVITATGHLIPELSYVDAFDIIDAGIHRGDDGKIHGDFDPDSWVYDWSYTRYTSVPGGVGLLTRAMLMKHMGETGEKA